MLKSKTILIVAAIGFLLPLAGYAGPEEDAITKKEKTALVETVCERIEKIYAFTENIQKICVLLKSNLEQGAYSKYDSPGEFAARLSEDLESVTHDKHFKMIHDPGQAAAMAEQAGGSGAFYTPQMVRQYRRMNYGFKELKILEGNVGYLDLRDFFPLKWASGAAVAAMNFLADCDAVIIDLRYNGGGEDLTVNFILSYFLDPGESGITFSTSFTRSTNSYYQSATWPYVPGRTLWHMPLYLLTSKSTFSGAEAFAFRLKSLKRASLVGETTRGGANPVQIQETGGKYVIYIPSETIVESPVAGDWEGVGVQPDIAAEASSALAIAHLEAVKDLAAKTGDEKERAFLRWTIDGIKAKERPFPAAPALLRSYAGSYGDRVILFEGNGLFFQRGGRAKLKMIPMAEGLFLVETLDQLRLRFAREAQGNWRLEAQYDDGRVVPFAKKRNMEVAK
jgi:hypothetical protein